MLRSGKSTRFFALAAGSRVPLWRPASRVMPTTIFRSHKDVRVHENGAGVAACRRSVAVAVDVWAREEMGVRCLKSASPQWLHHTLSILPAAMEKGCVPLRREVSRVRLTWICGGGAAAGAVYTQRAGSGNGIPVRHQRANACVA